MRITFVLALFAALFFAHRARAECSPIPAPGEDEQSLDAEADWVFVGDIVQQTPVDQDDPQWSTVEGHSSPVYMAITFEVIDALQGDPPDLFVVGLLVDYSLEPLPGRRYRVRAYDTERGVIMSTRCGRSSRSAEDYPTPPTGCSRCSLFQSTSGRAYGLLPLFLLWRRSRRRRRRRV